MLEGIDDLPAELIGLRATDTVSEDDLGGAKISDKISTVDRLLDQVDSLLVGGGMANTFLMAMGHEVGESLVEEEKVDEARGLIDRAGDSLVLPVDVVWNGPVGVFKMEPFAAGTRAIARMLADLEATVVVGGGETAAAVAQAGVKDRITHLSTGGGAFLEFLEGRDLPGVRVLREAETPASS